MPPRMTRLAASLFAAALVVSACSSGGQPDPVGTSGPTATGAPSDGPEVERDINVFVASYDVAVEDTARVLVGLTTLENQLIGNGSVELSFQFLGDGTADPVDGPSTTGEFLPVPGLEPTTDTAGATLLAPSDGVGVYEGFVPFDQAGIWRVVVAVELDGETLRGEASINVLEEHQVPSAGDDAPRSDNPTVDSDVPAIALDSRASEGAPVPDEILHESSIADALANQRPVVVLVSTPVYCVSRFCGPVTDTVQGLAEDFNDRAAFVHLEVWEDFSNTVISDAARDWIVTPDGGATEPWLFLVDGDGTIVKRYDNVADIAEVTEWLQSLPA